jgi:hypothetical protein
MQFTIQPSFTIVFQVKRGISSWLHKFATTAERALVAEFEHQGITSLEEKADFIKFLLGDVDDVSSRNRPFLWKSEYARGEDEDSGRKVCYARCGTAACSYLLTMYFLGVIPRTPCCENIS